jgi:hypothetical protein
MPVCVTFAVVPALTGTSLCDAMTTLPSASLVRLWTVNVWSAALSLVTRMSALTEAEIALTFDGET